MHHPYWFLLIAFLYGGGNFYAGARYGRNAEHKAWAELLKMGADAEQMYNYLAAVVKRHLR